MAVRITKGASTDGVSREFYASQCRDSSKLSGPGNGDHWWGVRNDCNGFFSIHHGLEEALAEAAGGLATEPRHQFAGVAQ